MATTRRAATSAKTKAAPAKSAKAPARKAPAKAAPAKSAKAPARKAPAKAAPAKSVKAPARKAPAKAAPAKATRKTAAASRGSKKARVETKLWDVKIHGTTIETFHLPNGAEIIASETGLSIGAHFVPTEQVVMATSSRVIAKMPVLLAAYDDVAEITTEGDFTVLTFADGDSAKVNLASGLLMDVKLAGTNTELPEAEDFDDEGDDEAEDDEDFDDEGDDEAEDDEDFDDEGDDEAEDDEDFDDEGDDEAEDDEDFDDEDDDEGDDDEAEDDEDFDDEEGDDDWG